MLTSNVEKLSSRTRGETGNALEKQAAPEILRTVESWIRHHPAICLGAGLVAGAALGWFVKRK